MAEESTTGLNSISWLFATLLFFGYLASFSFQPVETSIHGTLFGQSVSNEFIDNILTGFFKLRCYGLDTFNGHRCRNHM